MNSKVMCIRSNVRQEVRYIACKDGDMLILFLHFNAFLLRNEYDTLYKQCNLIYGIVTLVYQISVIYVIL